MKALKLKNSDKKMEKYVLNNKESLKVRGGGGGSTDGTHGTIIKKDDNH